MEITGIICEYNPLHLGHKKQLDTVRTKNPEGGIVCLMSGNFVQRGAPAIFDKCLRAKAAIQAGADLVLELPVTASLSSAEGFASNAVAILSPFCQHLCFGAESADHDKLMLLARALLSADFPQALKAELEKGLSFPVARQKALEAMGLDGSLLSLPNNILGVEYCKAILAQNCAMQPWVIKREGSYHDTTVDLENPSATALRKQIESDENWQVYVPNSNCYNGAAVHTLQAGEQAILYRLRTMTDSEFEALPYGSEGLWRKLMRAARECATLDAIIDATKSKRYTRTRIDRMILCAFLGITEQMLNQPIPYTRVLAFSDKGREILKAARMTGDFPNIGQRMEQPYQQLEERCGALYGLFAEKNEPANAEAKRRVYYQNI